MRGLSFGHRKLLGYLKLTANFLTTPVSASATYYVRTGRIFRAIFAIGKKMLTEAQVRKTRVISGNDAWSDSEFAERFSRDEMPEGIGGNLCIGWTGIAALSSATCSLRLA